MAPTKGNNSQLFQAVHLCYPGLFEKFIFYFVSRKTDRIMCLVRGENDTKFLYFELIFPGEVPAPVQTLQVLTEEFKS